MLITAFENSTITVLAVHKLRRCRFLIKVQSAFRASHLC